MDSALRSLLERTNPWLGDPPMARRIAEERLPTPFIQRATARPLAAVMANTRRAHLVIGPRQVGKSTLVLATVASEARHLLYLNCEEPLIREWCRSPGSFSGDLDAWLPRGGVLYLEEAQWLEEAGLFLKGLVDARLDRCIVATGSASFHLLARTRESLAGRATRHEVWPLSLREVAPALDGPAAAYRRSARAAFERQLIHGGYPEAWTSDDPEPLLHELVTAFVLRDASDRFRIARPDAFRGVLRLAAGQIGDVVNYSEWARVLGIATSTVTDYAALLEETHILRFVRPFAGGKRAELTQAPKVYYLDTGLRNAVGGGFGPLTGRVDLGHLVECWVFGELHKRCPKPGQVRFWRTRGGAEVDFVLEPELGRYVGVEVKAGASARLTRSTRSFMEAYRPSHVLLVHRGEERQEVVDGTLVMWVPAELLPEALDAAGC